MSHPVQVLVLRAAGVNCDLETAHAFEREGASVTTLHVNRLLAHPTLLDHYEIFAMPGGFSYGDDIAGGKVLAVELRHRLLPALHAFVERGGLVLGICNGFQSLVKVGLLPGLGSRGCRQDVTLTNNDSDLYEDRWVTLEACTSRTPFLEEGERFYLPVAHAEGKLVTLDETVRDELWQRSHVALCYVDPDGRREVPFPFNPNGSIDGIAGLIDRTGRVLGLMPHPERHLFGYHHPQWTRRGMAPEGDGARLFRRAVAAAREAR
ncbi:MAG: phosphoribosylformylglycinamidine synthase subunit PurQ [Planctomycetota bacterium]